MISFICGACLIILSIVYYHMTIGKYQRAINKIPGPPTLPFIGNVHLFGKNPCDILLNLYEWAKEYDFNRYRIWLGFEPNVVIMDPKDFENVLSSVKILKKSSTYDLLEPWLGRGLLTSFGSHWHSHRKMITPSFHFKVLVDFLGVMNKNSDIFMDKLRTASRGGAIFDFQALVCYFTLDVICDTAMGVTMNAMDNNDSELVKAFQFMCLSIQLRSFSILKRSQFLFKFFPEYQTYKKALKLLTDFTINVISKRQDTIRNTKNSFEKDNEDDESNNIRPKQAFLDTLLTAEINGKPLSVQDIFEEVSTFMFEGHDTTSSGISFAIYLLSRHPEVQKKVLDEQKQIFNGNLSSQATYNDLQEMKYLEMVIKETQRLYPSVPMIGRTTESPYDLNGTILPKDTTLFVFILAAGYNEKYFSNPFKFDPERFHPDVRVKPNPFEYIPFSAGPRNCVGQKFALLEMKCVISKIVRCFEILPPEDGVYTNDDFNPFTPKCKYDPILSAVLTLKSDNGIQIRLKERSCS